MDANEFTTLDEIGEEESKVKVNILENHPKFNSAAEEIDYLNKVLQGLENDNLDNSDNNLGIRSVNKLIDSNFEHNDTDCSNTISDFFNTSHLEQNINPSCEKTVSHFPENSGVVCDTVEKDLFQINKNNFIYPHQSNSSIENIEFHSNNIKLSDSGSESKDVSNSLLGSKLIADQQDFNNFPIPFSEIKTEPFDTDSYSMEDYLKNTGEDCNLSDFSAIKNEAIEIASESAVSETPDQETTFHATLIKNENLNIEHSEFILPKLKFKINKDIFYSKEELDAAMLMSMSSLARIMHMDMFADQRKNFPQIQLIRLEYTNHYISNIPQDDLDILVPFFNIYGLNIDEWKTIFKSERNNARKKSHKKKERHKSKKDNKNRSGSKNIKLYKSYKKLHYMPSSDPENDFEGFLISPKRRKNAIHEECNFRFAADSDSDDGFKVDVESCLSLIESPIKRPPIELEKLKCTSIPSVNITETSVNKTSKANNNSNKYLHSNNQCCVYLLNLKEEIRKYENDIHIRNCHIDCKASCKYKVTLFYPKNLGFTLNSITHEHMSRKIDNIKEKDSYPHKSEGLHINSTSEWKQKSVNCQIKPNQFIRRDCEVTADDQHKFGCPFRLKAKSMPKSVKQKFLKLCKECKSLADSKSQNDKIKFKLDKGDHSLKPEICGDLKAKSESKNKSNKQTSKEWSHTVISKNSDSFKIVNESKLKSDNDKNLICRGDEKFVESDRKSLLNKEKLFESKNIQSRGTNIEISDLCKSSIKHSINNSNLLSQDETKQRANYSFTSDNKLDVSIHKKSKNKDGDKYSEKDIKSICEEVFKHKELSVETYIKESNEIFPHKIKETHQIIAKDNEKIMCTTYNIDSKQETNSVLIKKDSTVHTSDKTIKKHEISLEKNLKHGCKTCTVCLKNIIHHKKYRKLVKRQLRNMKHSILSKDSSECKEKLHAVNKCTQKEIEKDIVKTTSSTVQSSCKERSEEHLQKIMSVSEMLSKHALDKTPRLSDKLKRKHTERSAEAKDKAFTVKSSSQATDNIHKSGFRIPKKKKLSSTIHSSRSQVTKKTESKFSNLTTYRKENDRIRSFNIGEKFKPAFSIPRRQDRYNNTSEGIKNQTKIADKHNSFRKNYGESSNSSHRNTLPVAEIPQKYPISSEHLGNLPYKTKSSDVTSPMPYLKSSEKDAYITDSIRHQSTLNTSSHIDNDIESFIGCSKYLDLKSSIQSTLLAPNLSENTLSNEVNIPLCNEENLTEYEILLDNDCTSIGGGSSVESHCSAEKIVHIPKPPSINLKLLSETNKIRDFVCLMTKKEKCKMYLKYKTRYIEAVKVYDNIPANLPNKKLKFDAYKEMKNKRKLYYNLKLYLHEERNDIKTVTKSKIDSNGEVYSSSHLTTLMASKTSIIPMHEKAKLSSDQNIESDAPYSPSGSICDVNDLEPYSPSAPIDMEQDPLPCASIDENFATPKPDAINDFAAEEIDIHDDCSMAKIDITNDCNKVETNLPGIVANTDNDIDESLNIQIVVGNICKSIVKTTTHTTDKISSSGTPLSERDSAISKGSTQGEDSFDNDGDIPYSPSAPFFSPDFKTNKNVYGDNINDFIAEEFHEHNDCSKVEIDITNDHSEDKNNVENTVNDIGESLNPQIIVKNICKSIVKMTTHATDGVSEGDPAISKVSMQGELSFDNDEDMPYSPSAPFFSPDFKTNKNVYGDDDEHSSMHSALSKQDRSPTVCSVHSNSDRDSLSSMFINSDDENMIKQSCISTRDSFMGQVSMSDIFTQSEKSISPKKYDSPKAVESAKDQSPIIKLPFLTSFLLPPPPLPTLEVTNFDKDVDFMKQFGICRDDFSSSYEAKDSSSSKKPKPISSLFNDLCNEMTKKEMTSTNTFSHKACDENSLPVASEDALSKFEKEIELLLEETSYYNVKPLAQFLIDKASVFPLVGLKYVLEVQKNVKNVDQCSYICSLCSKKMSCDTLIAHVKSVPHRLKFTSFHDMGLHSTYGALELKQWTAALVKEFTMALQKLESTCGRQQMAVCPEKNVPSAITYLKNMATEALAKMKDENRNKPKKDSVDISSVVASIMEMPKKSVCDINKIFPSKKTVEKMEEAVIDISQSPIKKIEKRMEYSPNRQPSNRQRSPLAKDRQRSPVSRRRPRTPVRPRSPWMDRRYPKQSKSSRSPVSIRRSHSPRRSRSPPEQNWSQSPFSRRKSRSPFSRRQSRSPFSKRQSRSPFSRRQSRSPFSRRQSRSPPRKRSRSPKESFKRGRSPSGYRRGPNLNKRTCSPSFGRKSISPRRSKRSRSPIGRNDYDRGKRSRVNRSPDRQDSSRLPYEDLKKVREFKAEENELKLNHFASLEGYLGLPESHPKYKVEWNMFWERRTQELRRKGISPSSHDFTGEWTEYWRKKLTTLCDDDFKDRQTQLLLRQNFDKRVMMFLKNDKNVDELMIKSGDSHLFDIDRSPYGKRSPSPWEGRLPESSNKRPLYEGEFTVYGTLKLLNELEDQLGSLGDSIDLLFNQTKNLLNDCKNPVTLFDDKDNRVLLKLSIGKLSSLVASGVLDTMSQAKTHMAIEHCNWLQKEIESTFPELPSFIAGLNIATIAESTLGMGHVQIAAYIAKQLMHIGNTNATENDLNSILSAVSANHMKISADNLLKGKIFTSNQSPFNPMNQASGNGFDVRPALFPSGTNNHLNKERETINIPADVKSVQTQHQIENDKKNEESTGALSLLMTSYEDNVKTIDDLSLEELQDRLMNFSNLNTNDQQELTDHLKKLEATDSKKVTKLRTMMRQSMKPIKTVQKNVKSIPTSSESNKPVGGAEQPIERNNSDNIGHGREFSNPPNPVESSYNRAPTSDIYNKPSDSYAMPTPHGENLRRDIDLAESSHGDRYNFEQSYQSGEAHFDFENDGNERSISDNALFPTGRDYSPVPPNQMQAMAKPSIPQGPGYQPYPRDSPHQPNYSESHPRPDFSGGQSRPRGSWPVQSVRGLRSRPIGLGHRPIQSSAGYRPQDSDYAPRPRPSFPMRHSNSQRFHGVRGRFDSPRRPFGRFSRPWHMRP